MMGEFHGGMFGGHVPGWLLWIVLAGIAVWLIVRGLLSPRGSAPSARETLQQRYARGEVDAAEYDDRRRRPDGGPDRRAT